MTIEITPALPADLETLTRLDGHISPRVLARKIAQGEVLTARQDGQITGWLRWGYFWDEIPFMNLLYVLEPYRRQGTAARLAAAWEAQMQAQGARQVLTSTLSNEDAQHLYRKWGYQDCGALLLPGEPLEILLRKDLPAPA